MKAVMPEIPEFIVAWRKRTGADAWDEMWEGVLHMAPAPNREHQDLQGDLYTWLRAHWATPHARRVHGAINIASIGGWPHDYRIPDLVLLASDRFAIDRNEYFEGAPTAVIEIRSPGDETMEKLDFYAQLGVPEVWVIDRDSRVPQLFLLTGESYAEQEPDAKGWLCSGITGVWLRPESDRRLAIQLADATNTRQRMPAD